ncbi:MAG: SPOR domain-containing protein [Bacteroidota bacterium]
MHLLLRSLVEGLQKYSFQDVVKSYFQYWLLFPMAALFLVACSSSDDTARNASTKPIREHEKTFDPSDYRTKPEEQKVNHKPAEAIPSKTGPVWVERTEKLMGFRVQLFSAANLDAAKSSISSIRSRLDSLQIDPGRMDMSFDAPYYKVRAGDFLVKSSADSLREQLKAVGIDEAWVVRDNVFRIVRELKK